MPATPDWDDIVIGFNAKFGTPKRNKELLSCAFWAQIDEWKKGWDAEKAKTEASGDA